MGSEVAVHGFPLAGRVAATRGGRLRAWAAVLLAAVVLGIGCVAALQARPDGTAAPAATTSHGLTSLPLAAQGPVSAALGRGAPAYRVADLGAANPAQRFRAGFSRHGVTVVAGEARLGMTLSAYGYGDALRPVGSAVPRASANRVSYARGALTEWYANGPLGIEQGFDLAARRGSGAGPLTLSLALSGNLTPRMRGGSVVFTGRGAALRYDGLVATDAHGRVLRSWLQLSEGHVLIRVADRGAAYPLRIDPLIQQGAKLVGTGAVGTGRFGYSLALSADGDTALVGARYGSIGGIGPESGIGAGAAWVFVRSGGVWTQQGGKLVGTGHTGAGEFAHVAEGEFGKSVALSGDGDTALVAAPRDGDGDGAVWVFTRSGSTWTQQGAKLTDGSVGGEGEFGSSVSLSADGDTALVGGGRDDFFAGAAWVFTRSSGTWAQQGPKLTASDEAGAGRFGSSVSLSADGDTALIGAPNDDTGIGAAWAFTRSGSTWSQQGAKMTGSGEVEAGRFGTSVALSGNGDTAAIGGPRDNFGAGAAWAFARSGGVWAQQGSKLTGSGAVGEGEFGKSVALSASGDTALIGGPGDDSRTGAAWTFARSAGAWSQQGTKLTGAGEIGAGEFGYALALSADGGTALVGAPEDHSALGAGWAFTRSSGTWTQQGAKLTGGEEDNAEQGVLVSLSADGNTALVGGWNDDGREGAAWVFVRSGGVWTQQVPKLTADEDSGREGFGTSVALAADGNTALIGEPGNDGRKGAAWVFTRSGSTWTQQGGKLVPAGAVGNPWFGYTVAISGDGKTALVGGWLDDGWKGAAWVFTRSGSTWSQEGPKLTANDAIGEAMFGTNVVLSADGNTALIGGWNDDGSFAGSNDYSGKGAAWVFTRSGSTWTQQGPKLTGGGESGNGKFGTIVALSASGDTALVGGWNDDTSKGAAWVFTRSGTTWSQQGPKLTGAGETGEGRFGVSAALSADGNTALIGGLADDGTKGAAWLFRRSGSTWSQQGGKITGTDAAGESEFGTNVALSADGATALIGGWRDNGGTGAAWAFLEPPTATTGAATAVAATSATLNGSRGAGASGKAYFQYGTTTAYGSSTAVEDVGTSGSASPLAAAIAGLAPGTTYHFRLVAENSGGVGPGPDQTFTTAAVEPPPDPAPKTETTTPPPPGDTLRPPVLGKVRQATARWRAGNRLATISRAKPPRGTTFSFSLDQQATVTFDFTRLLGRRKIGAGKLTFAGHSGANAVAFQGRISRTRSLGPGRYKLAITAANAAGMRSASKSLNFTIEAARGSRE